MSVTKPLTASRVTDSVSAGPSVFRYQNASDIRMDLQRLPQDRDSGQLATRPSPKAGPSILARRSSLMLSAPIVLCAFVAVGASYMNRSSNSTNNDRMPRKLTEEGHNRRAEFANTTDDACFEATVRVGPRGAARTTAFTYMEEFRRAAERFVNDRCALRDELTSLVARGTALWDLYAAKP
jgi:hypothetical protein